MTRIRKTYYQQRARALKLPNAYTAALTDYMRKPMLKSITNSDKSVTCQVTKKEFVLTDLKVTLYDVTNSVTETRTITRNRLGDFRFTIAKYEWANGIEVHVQHAAGSSTFKCLL